MPCLISTAPLLSLFCNFSVPLSNKTISFLYRRMKVTLCFSSVVIVCLWAPHWAWPDCCFCMPSTGQEWNWESSGKWENCPRRSAFRKWLWRGMNGRIIINKKKSEKWQYCCNLNCQSQIPKRCQCLLGHHAQTWAVSSPTVKSGPHQTWSCPQHASNISLFVLQILHFCPRMKKLFYWNISQSQIQIVVI